ncbi:CKMT2 [Symbiodinium sp. CCMP2592]|nr:CKMT2 [Symbiodinium sp. CCMP2592]
MTHYRLEPGTSGVRPRPKAQERAWLELVSEPSGRLYSIPAEGAADSSGQGREIGHAGEALLVLGLQGGSHDAYVRVRQAFEVLPQCLLSASCGSSRQRPAEVLSDQRLRADYDAGLRAAGEEGEKIPHTAQSRDDMNKMNRCRAACAELAPPNVDPRNRLSCASLSDAVPRELGIDIAETEDGTVVGMMDLPESAWAAALETHVAQVLECCRKHLQRSREMPNLHGNAAKESAAVPAEGPAVRGLYQTKRGTWEVSLSIRRVQCAIFNVRDIERAHDWHVALASDLEFRPLLAKHGNADSQKVELRRKAGSWPPHSATAAFFASIFDSQVDEKTTSAPSEREAFREALEEAYDADPELRLVLQFRVSIREAGWSHDIAREIRDAKTYEKKQKDLEKAKQAAMLQEVLVALEQLRREEAARQRKPVPLALPAPEEPLRVLPAPGATEEAAEPEDSLRAPPGSLQTQLPESQAEEVDGCVVPMKGFAKFCRAMSLSKPQREQLRKRVQNDMEVQNAIREAIVRHSGSLRGAPALKDKPANVPAAASRIEGGCSALVAYAQPSRGPPARKKGLLELLLEKHEAAFYPGLLTICELVRVTTTSRRAYSASAGATKRQLANFRLADFGRTTARSKRGRVLPGGEHRELRMLQECFRTRRFALQIQHLDLSTLEMSSISKQDFQYMLGCLPNLVSVIFPSRGWAGTLQLRTFVNIAKSLKVSIGALKGDLMILRGAAQRSTDEARPTPLAITAGETATPPSRKRPRVEVAGAPTPRPRRSTRREAQTDSDALGFRAALEDVRQSSERRILPGTVPATAHSAPANGQTFAPLPESHRSPDLQPAVQALRSGGLRRRKEITENQRDSRDRHAGSHSFWWPERR